MRKALHQRIPSWTLDRIVERWDSERDSDPGTASYLTLALGILGPSAVEQELLGRLAHALAHRWPEVRQSAVFACSLLGWAELQPLLQERRASELHPDVQSALDLSLREIALRRLRRACDASHLAMPRGHALEICVALYGFAFGAMFHLPR